jgi:hypothetical protein
MQLPASGPGVLVSGGLIAKVHLSLWPLPWLTKDEDLNPTTTNHTQIVVCSNFGPKYRYI